ncbi:hypothetical protein OA162_02325 [Synechococcus sp. AH-736-A19]|nr:hypothetical protein [Synechococcus sp. AH-736-A19]
MKRLLLLLPLLVAAAPVNGTTITPDFHKGMGKCSSSHVSHESGYNEGKSAAKILSLFVASGKKLKGDIDW